MTISTGVPERTGFPATPRATMAGALRQLSARLSCLIDSSRSRGPTTSWASSDELAGCAPRGLRRRLGNAPAKSNCRPALRRPSTELRPYFRHSPICAQVHVFAGDELARRFITPTSGAWGCGIVNGCPLVLRGAEAPATPVITHDHQHDHGRPPEPLWTVGGGPEASTLSASSIRCDKAAAASAVYIPARWSIPHEC